MIYVSLYMKENCPLCDDAEKALDALKHKWALHVEKVNIYDDDDLLERYQLRIPIIKANGHVIAEGIVSEAELAEGFKKISDK